MIQWHRAERTYDLQQDRVRQEVRAAIRNLIAERERLEIQVANVEIAEKRSEAATIKFDRGEISNRDKVEAEQDLLEARDELASATADFGRAIVAFYRDTGTLRIEDDGRWLDVARPIE
jgi:outer membrane protein TolC